MPTVDDYLKRVLKVYPLLNNLVIPSDIDTCLDFPIPDEHRSTGVPNTDLIVYVTAYSDASSDLVATAGACYQDADPAYNILAGRVDINAPNLDSLSIGSAISVIIHEMTHLLGFSNFLFQYFHKPNGDAYTSEEISSVITRRGKDVTILKLPTVVSKARAAFGCSTLEGLELEDQGGVGTEGSHWEKMLMYGDFMQGDTGADDWVFSDISFALLEDSGWYSVDYSQTDSIMWGKNAGCSFFTERCVSNGVASSSHFCADTAKSCTKSRNARGLCNLAQQSEELPIKFQYFTDTFSGGDDYSMDYCPIVSAYGNGDCRGLGS
jgi:leishmanolysin